MRERMDNLGKTYSLQLCLGLLGLPIGVLVGAIDAGFGRVLLAITDLRQLYFPYLIPFLPLAGLLVVYGYRRFGGKSGKGMALVFEVGHGTEDRIPLRLVPLVIVGTWMTHLFGGSAGREGVAVQIGATCSHWVGRHLPIRNASPIFLVAGMAAGFSGLFQTPIAAVLFAMEVLAVGELRSEALFPALTASFAASMTSSGLGLEKFTVDLVENLPWSPMLPFKLVALGMLFGVVGGGFAWLLKGAKRWLADRLQHPMLRIGVVGVGLSVLLLLCGQGRYAGLGTNLINACFDGGAICGWDWLLKLLLTILTLAAGFQGGEVTPLFSIGASLGVVLAGVVGLPLPFAAAMGYAAVFGSATNTLLAPALIGAEVFGFQYLPYFGVVCAIAYVFNLNQSIYLQRGRAH